MENRVIMGNTKKHCTLSLTSAALIRLAAGVLACWLLKPTDVAAAATDGAKTIAISVDGMTPMPDMYEIPVGSEQGFSVLSMSNGSPAGLVRTGEAEWSLATDANATLETVPGEFVATVRADAPGEAGLYVATPDGASDMVTLVFTELKAAGSAKNDGPSSVTVVQPAGGSVVYVPDAEATALPLVAETNAPDATKSVVFTWPDSVAPLASFEDSSGAPFWATVPEINGINTVEVEALGKDGAAPVTARGSWVMATATDSNRDGFPDAPFELNLTAGDMWHYSPAGPGGLNVVMAGLPSQQNEPSDAQDSNAFSVFAHGAVGLYEVRVPRNLLDEHETGILVIGEAPEPTTLLNRDLASSLPPMPAEAEALLSSVLLVDVLVQRNGSASWVSIGHRLRDDPLEVKAYEIPGLSEATNARLYSLDVLVADSHSPSGPHVGIPAGAAWKQPLEGVTLESETFSTKLRAPALVGLFQTGSLINITGINNVAIGGARDYGIGGGVIEITVENLGGVSTTDLGVIIGGQAAAVSSVAGNVVTAVVPRAADLETPAAKATVDIGIEIAGTGDFDAIPNGFTYLGPEVASITPVHGPSTGGTDVILAGNGFDANGTVVSLDGAPVLVDSVTPNTVAGVTSAGNPGTADLEVLTANNFRGTATNAFMYTPPAPVLTDVTPGRAPTSAQSTLRVEGSFINMSSGSGTLNGHLRAFFDSDVKNPAANSEAAYVMFRDESHIDVVTPSGLPAGATGLFVRATVLDESASFTTTSNVLPFSFVEGTQAEMAISGVMPAAGPLSGGNVVWISGSDFPPAAGEFTKRGNVIRVGRVATEGEDTVEVPVCLYRAPDASAGPSAMRFSLGFETSMLSCAGHITNPVLETEYGKSVVCNVREGGLGILIFGGTEEITLENQTNPFELFRLTFEVAGNPGENAVLPVHDLSMAGPSGTSIPDTYGDAGVVTVGDTLSLPEPPQVSFGPNAARVIGVTDSQIQVIAPAGVRLGTVDVLVQDTNPGNPDNIAVCPAFEGKGYTYIPEGGLRVSRVLVSENNGVLPPEGGRIIVAGQGFRNVSALTLMFADGAMVALDTESDYVVDNDGRITLTIAPERLEELRKNGGLKEGLPAGPVTLMLETAGGAATIENAFVVGAETTEMTVSGISPDGAWVIGGLVAEIVGQNFGAPESMTAAFEYTAPHVERRSEKTDVIETVTIPLEILTGSGFSNNSTTLYVRIPPLPGVDDAWPASVAMNRLVVTKEGSEEAGLGDGETGSPFTYYRWQNAGGVTTTAFYYENAAGADEREIVLDSEAENAALSIPPLDNRFFDKNISRERDRVYVLARAARDAAALGETGLTDLPGE
ncbi:MAG: IPT/TIG domain-containing protein, partial [Candidatus Hydrogenedentota bacterium]